MKYDLVKKYSKEIFDSDLDYKTWGELEDDLEEALNEAYEPYKIGCCEFYAGQILRELDPIAFSQDVNLNEDYYEVCLEIGDVRDRQIEVRYYNTEELETLIEKLEGGTKWKN